MLTVKDTQRATVQVCFDGSVRKAFHGPKAAERFENEVKVLRHLELAGCDFVPRIIESNAEKLILGFLRATQASLGGSKSLVDLSGEGEAVLRFMTHMNQIGQTGATPRHAKGLSTCCHGEEPHTVGWRFIGERRAVNLDPNCGWARGKADVLYVADAFKVMAKVNELMAVQT